MSKDNRTNLYTFLIYPDDSAPDNYVEIIQSWHIPALLSPIHDRDPFALDPDEKFKPHIHIMLYFGVGQKKSSDQIKFYSDQLHGTVPFSVNSRNAMTRYFIHRDNPNKQQFEESDLVCLSGFEIGDAFGSYLLDQQYFDFIEKVVIDNKFCNLADLIIYLNENNMISEVRFVRTHTYYFDRLMDGIYKRVKRQKEMLKIVEK